MQTRAEPVAPYRPRWWRQLLRRGLAALPRSRLLVRGPDGDRSVCLTFDDGPHPEHTPRLLDVLKDLGAPATFFVVGRQAERHPGLVRRMAAEGHLVGNHSFTHGEPARTSARHLLEEVRQTAAVLTPLAGRQPPLFRPPKGQLTVAKAWRLWRAGQTIVLWSADPKDYACGSAAEVRGYFERRPLGPGDVVLMHDTHPHAAEVLPAVIAAGRARGLSFTTLARWLPAASSGGTGC
jgi:peptidoglycan/xylan/chitin deacetylase (PgdA/CDA1 family)